MLSVLIVCNFEKDLCHWERQPENADSKYAWFRNTSEALESAGLQGPSGTVYILGQLALSFSYVVVQCVTYFIAPSKEILYSKIMTLGEVGVSLPRCCHALVCLALGS